MKLLVFAVLCVASTASADTAGYLDARATAWVEAPPPIANIPCALSCHTTFPYMLARRHLGTPADGIRAAFEARVPKMIARTAEPFYGKRGDVRTRQSHATEAVLTAVALLADDRAAGTTISKVTRDAIDHMWSMQRKDGGFDWLNFNIEPWESSEDWGAAVALTVASEPRLVSFLRARVASTTKPMKMHDRVALLWTSRGTGLLDDQRAATITGDLLRTQRTDGGFSLSRWVDGPLRREQPSDGYATALGVLALCGDKARAAEVKRGLQWLRDHRAGDGSYPGLSQATRTTRAQGYATDAATAYAVLALATCK